ncbi:Pol polyprotein [Thelohanellus kitauei]|uniref:Pol polyprotein n=1 Tax=Thelohanellus kitauei TaxID=669202 RepID=A0A0C2ISL1_THEKT|nr:Pol polyprotein [Thelohanellus kitauei]
MCRFNTAHTIAALKSIFALERLPKSLFSGNCPQFLSEYFRDFCNQIGIEHIFFPPYHPKSNGDAERIVLSLKRSVSKSIDSWKNPDNFVDDFMFSYRFIPLNGCKSLSELMHGRQMRH